MTGFYQFVCSLYKYRPCYQCTDMCYQCTDMCYQCTDMCYQMNVVVAIGAVVRMPGMYMTSHSSYLCMSPRSCTSSDLKNGA